MHHWLCAIACVLLASRGYAAEQDWNLHLQNTVIVQGDPAFHARYSGPNSLRNTGEVEETVTADLFAGLRLWRGAEIHLDALAWQGFGLSKTLGIEAFPNGDAYKLGTSTPDVMAARLFLRQTIGLGGPQEVVDDGPLALAGAQDVSRLTITLGRFTPTDVFDQNAYAGDPHRQFLNWAAIANLAWDYAADSVGFTTGVALELNHPAWALRYGFFQLPAVPNSFTAEDQVLKWPPEGRDGPFTKAWDMPVEVEGRYHLAGHPGALRLLAWLNEAHMATYRAATAILLRSGPNASIAPARAFRFKYGFGLNWEQELAPGVGAFSRLGWNDGRTEAWAYTDTNYSGSLGVSITGRSWSRPADTFGLLGIVSGASRANRRFLAAGGTGILAGDGALAYGWEKSLETYYDVAVWPGVHLALDYQLVSDPAFNRARGPVSIVGVRLHWELALRRLLR
jgi:high affinity Mn2+ porin